MAKEIRPNDDEEGDQRADRPVAGDERVVDDDLLDHRREGDDHLAEHRRGDGEEDPSLVDRQERAEPAQPAARRRGAGRGPAGRWPPRDAPRRRAASSLGLPRRLDGAVQRGEPGERRGAVARRRRSRGSAPSARRAPPRRSTRAALPSSVSSSPTPRRSPSISMRRTQPRVTSPSSRPVSVDLDSAARCASRPARWGDEPIIVRIRYCASDMSGQHALEATRQRGDGEHGVGEVVHVVEATEPSGVRTVRVPNNPRP